MKDSFPFHTLTRDAGIYHTHPRCRIAQAIAAEARVEGTGEGRECPFCFLLVQFQANRALHGHLPNQGPGTSAAASERTLKL